jgi:hypothetical protein
VPDTHLVQSVSDGTRTWKYAYDVGENGTPILTTVTLPDKSSWNLAGLDGKAGEPGLAFMYIGYGLDGGTPETPPPGEACDVQPTGLNSPVATGRLVHPSGAVGSFTMTPTSHARNGVPRLCYSDNPLAPALAYYPQYYDLYSLTNKTITGPGLPSMKFFHWHK